MPRLAWANRKLSLLYHHLVLFGGNLKVSLRSDVHMFVLFDSTLSISTSQVSVAPENAAFQHATTISHAPSNPPQFQMSTSCRSKQTHY